MAEDRECWDGTGTNKNNCLLKDNVQLLTISQADCLKNDILENMKDSFFLGGKRSDMCHCFGSNSVVSLDVHALDVHCDTKIAENVKFSQICEENEENCRKKRCTDRYDSSESSDSGVAALSSSSTSDITDPGSPFSTASTHSSNSESGDEKPSSYQSTFPSTPVKARPSHWLASQHKEMGQAAKSVSDGGSDHVGSTRRDSHPPEPADYIDLLEASSPCFIGKPRGPTAENVDGRNFISLGNADTLLRISQPCVTATKTRSVVWNLTAPKATRSYAGSEELPALPNGSAKDDRLTAPGLLPIDAASAGSLRNGGLGSLRETPAASKIPPVPKITVPTSIQTRRNSATQGLNNLSNSYRNTGSSNAVGSEVFKKDKPGTNSAILSAIVTHHASEEEASKLAALPSTSQARGKSCGTHSRTLSARPIDSKTSPGSEESAPSHTSTKASSPVTNCTKESSDFEPNTSGIPSLATIALTVPTYCILSSKTAQSRGNKVLTCTKTQPGECFQSPSLPAPRSFQWTHPTSKSPDIASYLVSGNTSITLQPAGTGPTKSDAGNSGLANLNSIQAGISPVQVRLLSKSSMLPDMPLSAVNQELVPGLDCECVADTCPPAAPFCSSSKASPKKNVMAKPIPSAKVPNKRLKYHLTQTKLIQEKVSDTNRNIYVTRQQTQRCCVSLPMLPNHLHNTRKSPVAEETETALTKTPHQGKITEYFKTQRKPVGNFKKELPKDVASPNNKAKKITLGDIPGDEETGLDKYFSLISPPSSKITKKVHVAANKNVSITSPVQVFLLNKLDSDSRVAKLLNNYKPQNGLVTSPRKTPSSALKVPERNNGIHPPTKPMFLVPATQKVQKKCSLSPKKGALSLKSGQLCKMTQPNSNNFCSTSDIPMLDHLIGSSIDMNDHSEGCSNSVVMNSSSCDFEKQTDIVMECSNLVVHEGNSVDSESGISSNLSVVVSTSLAPSFPMISPILSAPKTIRFPATQRKSLLNSQHDIDDKTQCRWVDCSESFHSSTGLMEHLQTKHVIPQTSGEHYVCMWVGCKVFSRKSCSQSWLERHALSHGGNKPFRCIVDGCGQRFGSNTALERHVNGHFDQEAGGSNAQGPRRSLDGVSGKMMRRNGKKLRYRKQPWSARMFDYFDSGIMEGLQHRLVGMTQARTSGLESTPGDTIVLTSKVMARRIAPDGTTRFLLKWFPADVLDDEWVAQSQVVATRSVPIPQLPASSWAPLHSALLVAKEAPRNKHRRKPLPRDT